MKTFTLLILSLLITTCMFGQERAIKITNQKTNKEIIIKENRRIKVKTLDGQKISGRFKIENNSIFIKDKQIEFANIAQIKRNPLLLTILSRGALIYGGAVTAGLGTLIGVFADANAFWLLVPATAMIYIGAKSPSKNKIYKKDSNRTFEFITISN